MSIAKDYTLDPKKFGCVVLLSTFNGAKYLDEQLKSLVDQSYKNFQVFIRDDGSTDNSRDIIRSYAKYLNLVVDKDENHYGLFQSYSRLLQEVKDFAFIAFCDQDDIWNQDKILNSITQLKSTGALLLVHQFEILIDGRVLTPSVEQAIGNKTLAYVATRNIYPGNTFLFKGELLQHYNYNINVPHDWQLILRALELESVTFLGTTLSKYRIHDANAIGVRFGYRNPWELILNAAAIYRWRCTIFQSSNNPVTQTTNFGRPGSLAKMIFNDLEISPSMKINLLLRVLIQSFSYKLINSSLLKKSSLH
jgi:rhamnosyltransferase